MSQQPFTPKQEAELDQLLQLAEKSEENLRKQLEYLDQIIEEMQKQAKMNGLTQKILDEIIHN